MKKFTLRKILAIFTLILSSNIAFTQIANPTGLIGEDLIFYDDGNGFFTAPTGSTITDTQVTLATERRNDQPTLAELNYTRPATTYPAAVAVDPFSYRFRANNNSANHTTDSWIVINSIDLSAYDSGNKYFTFSTKSEFREQNGTNIETDTKVFYTTNFTTGADPTVGGVVWTEIPSTQFTTVGSSPSFGNDGNWTTNQIDLSAITAGTEFAIAFRRQTSSDGPNPNTTVFGDQNAAEPNRNGSMLIGEYAYTGTPLRINVTPGAFSGENISASSQTNIFKNATSVISDTNFSNTSWGNIFRASSTFTPRFQENTEIPAGEGYKFEVNGNYSRVALSSLTIELNKIESTDGTTGGNPAAAVWRIQGSNDDSSWDDLTDEFEGVHQVNTTYQLSTSQPYRLYRIVLVNPWTPNNAFAALRYIDFTIASVWNGINNNITDATNFNTDTQPGSSEIIIPNTVSNYPTLATGTSLQNEITLKSGASFVTEGTATVTGTFNFERNLTFTSGNDKGWHLVGAPIASQTYNDDFVSDNKIASGSANNRGIATYNNGVASNNWVYLQDAGSGTFTAGTGYAIKTSENRDVVFSGTLNTSDPVLKGITVGTTPFNLVSNPFASHINSETFLDLAANSTKLTSKTIWVWNPSTENYDVKISTDAFIIAPGQGFFVSAVSAGDLEFAKSNQTHSATNTFQKNSSLPKVILNITNGELKRYAEIRYNDNATKGFDNGYDGERFTGVANSFDVFTQLLSDNQGTNYQIQSLPNSNLDSMIIPVGVSASSGNIITFSAEALNLPSNNKVFLEDREKSMFTRLDDGSLYEVSLTSDLSGTGRFYLHTAQKALSTLNIELENISMYKTNNSNLRIIGLEQGETSLKMFTILGKEVLKTDFNASGSKDITLPNNLATGVYIVKITTAKGELNKKIIIE